MPPAGMKGDVEGREAFACHCRDEIRRGGELIELDPPALDFPFQRAVEHLMRALAHGGGTEQALQDFRSSGQKLPRSRPTVFFSASALGGPSGVK